MSLLSRALSSRALALLALAAGLLAAPLLRAQYGPDNPDPSGHYITNFEFTQSTPGLPSGTSYDAARKLPGRDTYLMIPDRTGLITLSVALTFTHSALKVVIVDSMGAVVTSTSSVSSGTPISLSIPVIKFYPPFHVTVKNSAGNSTVAVKTIVIPRDANAPDTPLFVGSPSAGGVGGPLQTPPPSAPHYPVTSQGNESSVAGENYGSCGSCAGTCTTMPPPVTTTQDEADISGPASVSGPLGQGFLHNTQSAGTSMSGMSTSYLGFDISPTGGISRANFKVNGSGDVTVLRDGGGITEITTASLYTKVETVSTPATGVKVSQWRTQADSVAIPAVAPLRASFYRTTGTNEITKTTTIDSHPVDTVWRYTAATPKWELVMGNGLRKKEITLESNGGDASLRLERQKLFEWDSTASPAAYVLVSDVIVTYKRHSFGWKKVKQEVLGLSGNPLTTVWEYWGAADVTGTAGSTNGQGLLKHVARPDGWSSDYTYNFALGAGVYSRNATSPYLGTAGGCAEYINVGPSWCSRLLVLSGQTVEQSMSTWSGNTLTEQTPNGPTTLIKTTTVVTIGTDFGGLPTQVVYPDGTALIATYSRGGGTAIIWNEGELSGGSIVDGTTTERYTDDSGFPIGLLKTDIATSIALEYPLVTSTDAWGRPETVQNFNNPALSENYTYNCCGLATVIDRDGLLTSYAHDDVHRLVKANRAEVSYQTVYAGLEVRSYRYPEVTMSSPSNPTVSTYQVSISSRDLSGTVTVDRQRSPETGNMVALSTATTVYQNPDAAIPNPGGLAAGIGMKTTRVLTGATDDAAIPQEVNLTYLDGRTYQTTGNLGTRLRYVYSLPSYDMNWDGTPDTVVRTVTTTRLALDDVTLKESAIRTIDRTGKTLAAAGFGAGATHYLYNSLGQLVKSKDADGVIHLYGYNNLGDRVLSVLDLDADGTVDYGSDQVSFTETRPYAGGSFDAVRTVARVWQPGSPPGTPTTLSYQDAAPDGLHTRFQRFPSVGGIQSAGARSLGSGGAWTETITREDSTISRRYLEDGRLVAETFWAAGSTPPGTAPPNIMSVATAGFIQGTAYSYDDLGRLEITTDSRTGPVTRAYVSVACDYVQDVTDAASRVTAYLYDDRGRRTAVNSPDTPDTLNPGNTFTNVVTTHYYEDDTVKEVNGATYRTAYTYDYAQRMATLATYATATPAITSWTYSATTGWLQQKTYPDGSDPGTTPDPGPSYTYTSAGRLKTRQNARGQTTRYDYDAGGRLIAELHFTSGTTPTASAGNDATTPDAAYTHDALGRPLQVLTSSTAAKAATRIVYDYSITTLHCLSELFQIDPDLTFTSSGGTLTISSGATAPSFTRYLHRKVDGLLRNSGADLRLTSSTGSTLDVGATLTYHSSHGRLETVTGDFNGATSLFTYTYTANSSLVSTITGPAYLAGHAWDATRDIMTTRDNHFITAYVYDVNDLGQRTANTYTNPWTWHYDAKGQVVSAQRSGSSAMSSVYEFDGIGNRKKSAAGSTLPGSDNYTANALNQYTAVAGGSPTYDDDGNLTADAGLNPAAVARLYEWEGGNRLDKVRTASSGTVTATFLYDAYGRRVSKTAGSTTTIFCYDGWNLIAEYTSTGGTPALARSHTWGLDLSGTMQGAGGVGGLLATRIVGSGTYYPCYDGNGNVMQYVNSAGTIVVAYEYGPFGSIVYANDPLGLQFRICFSTKYQDGETGWYYYGYRYYDAQLGRWPSRDPIEEEGGVNLYGSMLNDGINEVDVLGQVVTVAGGSINTTGGSRLVVSGGMSMEGGKIIIQGGMSVQPAQTTPIVRSGGIPWSPQVAVDPGSPGPFGGALGGLSTILDWIDFFKKNKEMSDLVTVMEFYESWEIVGKKLARDAGYRGCGCLVLEIAETVSVPGYYAKPWFGKPYYVPPQGYPTSIIPSMTYITYVAKPCKEINPELRSILYANPNHDIIRRIEKKDVDLGK